MSLGAKELDVVGSIQLSASTMYGTAVSKCPTNYSSPAWQELRKVVIDLAQSREWVPSRQLTQRVFDFFLPEGEATAKAMKRKAGEVFPHMVEEGLLEMRIDSDCDKPHSPIARVRYTAYRWTGKQAEGQYDLALDQFSVDVLNNLFPITPPATCSEVVHILHPNVWYTDDEAIPGKPVNVYHQPTIEDPYDEAETV